MKKVINFCKLYLSEIFFAVAVILCVGVTMYSILYLPKMVATGITGFAVVALAVFGYCFQKLAVSHPSKVFTITWCAGFALLMLSLIISTCIVYSSEEMLPFYILLIISGIAFVAMFGLLIVVSDVPSQKVKDATVADATCDDDIHGSAGKLSSQNTKLGDEFDVLCEVNGQKVRLPFSKRNLGKPLGIFPSKYSPLYFELEEVNDKKHSDIDVDESRLPDEKYFCEGVAAVKDRMNLYLQELDSPILDGIYLADSPYMQGCGWLVGFKKGDKRLSSDYYGGNKPAKLRYMGNFEGKCQK